MDIERTNRLHEGPTLADVAAQREPEFTMPAGVIWYGAGVAMGALCVIVWRWVYG